MIPEEIHEKCPSVKPSGDSKKDWKLRDFFPVHHNHLMVRPILSLLLRCSCFANRCSLQWLAKDHVNHFVTFEQEDPNITFATLKTSVRDSISGKVRTLQFIIHQPLAFSLRPESFNLVQDEVLRTCYSAPRWIRPFGTPSAPRRLRACACKVRAFHVLSTPLNLTFDPFSRLVYLALHKTTLNWPQ